MNYHNTLDAVVYQETAAENYALYAQSFRLARFRLNEIVEERLKKGCDPEVFYITADIDETLLDSGPYRSWLIATGRDYHQDTWNRWCKAARSPATPHAVGFIQEAVEQLGIKVFYVSSRYESTRDGTVKNLATVGFPVPDGSADPASTHIYLYGMPLTPEGPPSSKKEQYSYLSSTRMGAEPLLRLGDNLSDLDPVRYRRSTRYDVRRRFAEEDGDRWGDDRIVFPNPIYGHWRDSLRTVAGDADHPVADEPVPAPYQPQPVRPPVSSAEAPKMGLLRAWTP
jgi:5'-nucleotidase (lipoprotein e(P4) family)